MSEFQPWPKPKRKVKVRKVWKSVRAFFGVPAKPSKMFAKRRVPGYKQWIVTFECIIAGKHVCRGRVICCHVKSRGSGGDDIGNCYPGCEAAHDEQGLTGIVTFQRKYDTDLRIAAIQLGRMYQRDIAPCP